ncbi:c-type cytochrome [Dyadobacter psychrotolerans]|uniref:Cytochrome c n=1 Tax=Dyadobacter psychrotolerans TaxID=2541721 RepID=A0A4R5DPX4_9BACT|nr:cytochrome c [Dyadobacter psychrotolerans]TDE16392.1 cytochrome c [Dyadobacter psychrotolerans]
MNINNRPSGIYQIHLPKYCFLFVTILISSCQNAQELKTEQYFAEGFQLYTTNCANCHQTDGKGMANLYPPLSGSASIKDKALFACIIKNGMKDTIVVAGKKFSRPMPANSKLTELEIAEIITYVSMKWSADSTLTSIDLVSKSLQQCAAVD